MYCGEWTERVHWREWALVACVVQIPSTEMPCHTKWRMATCGILSPRPSPFVAGVAFGVKAWGTLLPLHL